MSSLLATFAEDVIDQPVRAQFEVFLDRHRGQLNGCLDGLTEAQVRPSLVPSRTTSSLGLDDTVHGNRRGPLPLRWVYLSMLRELAPPCGPTPP